MEDKEMYILISALCLIISALMALWGMGTTWVIGGLLFAIVSGYFLCGYQIEKNLQLYDEEPDVFETEVSMDDLSEEEKKSLMDIINKRNDEDE